MRASGPIPDEDDERRRHEQLVGQRIEEFSEIADLIAVPRDITVEEIADAGHNERRKRGPAERQSAPPWMCSSRKTIKNGISATRTRVILLAVVIFSILHHPINSPSQASVTSTVTKSPGVSSSSESNRIRPSISGESANVRPYQHSSSAS